MSKVVFHGEGAGLGRVEKGGDTNDVANYCVECSCGMTLVLGGNRRDAEGRICVGCPRCEMATVVDRSGQVLKVLPIAEFRAMQVRDAQRRAGR
jgi:hypothetical protein